MDAMYSADNPVTGTVRIGYHGACHAEMVHPPLPAIHDERLRS